MSEFLTYCADIFNVYIAPFEGLSQFMDTDFSPVISLFSFARCFPFFFLCVCLTVVGVFALIKNIFFSKNYI